MRPEDQARFPAVNVRLKNGASVAIRPLRRSDSDALGEFYASVPREDFRFYCPHELTRAAAARNCEAADDPRGVVLVAEASDQIAGYAWFRWEHDDSPSSSFGICVRRGWQGSGAGRALIERIKEVARSVGPPVMALTVQEANPAAVALYQKLGFQIVRSQTCQERFGFAPEPEYAMEMQTRPCGSDPRDKSIPGHG